MIASVIVGVMLGAFISVIYIREIVGGWYVHYLLLVVFLVGLSYALQRERISALLALIAMSATVIAAVAIETQRKETV